MILLTIFLVFIMVYPTYLLHIVMLLMDGDYKAKKEFYKDLIPFRFWIRSVKNKLKELE
jgi:hypothetical protein